MALIAEYPVPAALTQWAAQSDVTTIPQLFQRSVAQHGSRPFLGEKVHGTYQFLTYSQVHERVMQLAAAFVELGLQPGDRVANLSNNRVEWPVTDLAAVFVGLIHVPLYATLAEGDIAYILQDSGARVIVTATEEHTKRVLAIESQCPDLEHVVAIEAVAGQSKKRHWSWTQLLDFGKQHLDRQRAEIERRTAALTASDVATLVYTSGTTGNPKGTMLMHGNFVSNAMGVLPILGATSTDVELSFLPLAHTFERIAYYTMLSAGAAIGYAENTETVAANMLELNPTVVPSVPRLFEKIQARVLNQIAEAPPLRQKIFHWAVGIGRKYRDAKDKGAVPGGLALQHKIAHKLVFSKIHARTGGKVRYFISGGAPLRRDVGDFFMDVGFPIIEGYGLTETTPVITVNPPERPKIGTVGKPLKYNEVKIADDGEILAKGPNIMRGYFNRPEATAECIDADGWFHTGDIGRFDEDGYLVITDRKKELLVMSNGKNVAPQPIEQRLKESPWIEQAVLIGDNRNFISAVVVPTFDRLDPWAKEQGLPSSREELAKHPRVYELIFGEVEKACREMSNYEKVKKIAILPAELSQDTGELTPTLKVKRRVVTEKYAQEIEGMYSGGA